MMLHRYFIKTPWIVPKLFPAYTWRLSSAEHAVYLTFDDGPHPSITPWVLDELKKYGAQATFFCIGNNVEQYPSVYRRILEEGHAVGNHTFHHVNGWQTTEKEYVEEIAKAARLVKSDLFRPPYGKIRAGQSKKVAQALGTSRAHIIMWDVLSADFDTDFTPAQCYSHVERNVRNGSIIVFHDSEKASVNMKFALTKTLEFLKKENYAMKKIVL